MAVVDFGISSSIGFPGVPSMPHGAVAYGGSDTDTFPRPTMVYSGDGGDITVVPWGTTTAVQFVGIPAGTVVPVCCRQLMATGTTSAEMVLLF